MAFKPIFIVEDDEDIRLTLEELFESEGYSVFTAKNGQIALNILTEDPVPDFGIIFVDFMMPILDGPTMIDAVLQKHPDYLNKTAIYLMTARSDVEHAVNQTTGILKKPLDLDELCLLAKLHCQ